MPWLLVPTQFGWDTFVEYVAIGLPKTPAGGPPDPAVVALAAGATQTVACGSRTCERIADFVRRTGYNNLTRLHEGTYTLFGGGQHGATTASLTDYEGGSYWEVDLATGHARAFTFGDT